MAAFGRKFNPKAATAARVTCDVCGNEGSMHASNMAREVVGWLAPRVGGGANHIRDAKPTGRYRHVVCLSEEKEGKQESLF